MYATETHLCTVMDDIIRRCNDCLGLASLPVNLVANFRLLITKNSAARTGTTLI